MASWNFVKFEEIYLEPSKNGLNRPKRVRGTGYKMVNMGEIFAYDRISNPVMELVPMNEIEKEKYSLRTGDLLFARQSLVAAGAGKCSIVMKTPEITTFESHLIRVRLNQTKAIPLFYYYYFSSHIGKNNIQSLVMQVAAAGIRGSELAKLPVPYPPISTQQKIANILSAYDELIQNNTRRIKILEEMAQSLYHEWFVKFRFPGHEQVKMFDSELGLIPEGWEATIVEKIGASGKSIVSGPFGSNIGKKFFVESGIPVIRGNNLTLGKKKFIDDRFVFITEEKAYELRNCEALPGDIIFTAAGTLGQIGLIPHKPKYSKYIISNKQLRLRCNTDLVLPEFIYYWFSRPEMITYIINQNKGASVPLITLGILRSLPVLLPPLHIQRKFAQFVCDNSNLIENLEHKNSNLRQTRDLLLPKLISGEIDVEKLEIDTGNIAA